MGEDALTEEEAGDDPLALFRRWAAGQTDAVVLATATADGAPSARMVLLKGADERGLRFFTGRGSRKARELAENPRAAILCHWPGRQVRVEGPVEPLAEAAAAAYFATRPRASRLAAWASRQSEPLASRFELDEAVRAAAERFEGGDVPLPPHWGGYLLRPVRWEFWQHRDDRLHDRLSYEALPGAGWRRIRLFP